MRTVYFPRWILAADGSLIERAALAVEGEHIAAIGSRGNVRRDRGDRTVNLGDTLLLPGLINLHTHLEEGACRGYGPEQGESFASHRAKRDSRLRQAVPSAVASSVRLGIRELLTNGVTTVLDTSRLGLSAAVLDEEPIRAWVQHETHPDPVAPETQSLSDLSCRIDRTPAALGRALGPHTLYSLLPENHRRSIHLAREHACLWACHIAESAEEVQAFADKSGDLFSQITRRRDWPYGTNPTGPMYYAITRSLIPNGAIAFHANYATGHDLSLLAAKQVTVVICPGYTQRMGHKPFPVDLARSRGVRLAVATESVADAPSLNLFDDLYLLRTHYPQLPPRDLLAMVTRTPAAALGMGSQLGALAPGRRADIVGVAVPHDPQMDVLEELVQEEPTVRLVIVDGQEIITDS